MESLAFRKEEESTWVKIEFQTLAFTVRNIPWLKETIHRIIIREGPKVWCQGPSNYLLPFFTALKVLDFL